MITGKLSRREALVQSGLLFGAALSIPEAKGAETARPPAKGSFRFSLNMATIRGQKLGIVKEVEIANQAGYDGIEPWVESVQRYAEGGGSLSDLKKRIADSGLTVEGAIGFPDWPPLREARRFVVGSEVWTVTLFRRRTSADGDVESPAHQGRVAGVA